MTQAKGIIANCKTGEISEIEIDYESTGYEEQELLDSIKPSEKEILMAEIELNTINLLLEMGVF